MKLKSDNFYWELFKTAAALTGGAAVAGGLVAGGFKLAKHGLKTLSKVGDTDVPEKEEGEDVGESETPAANEEDVLLLEDD